MPAITTNDLKNGMTLQLDNGLFTVVDFQHVKPGKGGAFVRTTLRNSRTGAVIDRTFRAAERVEQAILEKKDMQFLYRDGDEYVFMDTQSYDQLHVAPAALGPRRPLPGRVGHRQPGARTRTRSSGSSCPPRSSSTSPRPSRRAGRPGVGGPQAGHPRDRPHPAGAAVREPGRPHQGRHPLGRLHHPRLTASGPS